MSTFLKIYGLIILIAVIATLTDRFVFKKKEKMLVSVAVYGALFYWVVSVIRTLSGSGYNFVSYTFFGKELRGYIKVTVLLLAVYAGNTVLSLLIKEKYDRFVNYWAGYFAVAASLYVVLITQLQMRITLRLGLVAAVAAIITLLLKKDVDIADKKQRYILTTSQLLLFAILYYIVGPLELYAYNADDFLYGFADFYPLLIAGSLIFVVTVTVLVTEFVPEIVYKIYVLIVGAYGIIGYVQSFILNGKMTSLDGSEQVWSTGKIVINIIIWIVLVAVLAVIAFKVKIWNKIFIGAAGYIVLIQLFTLVFIFLTTDVTSARTMQITEKDSFTVSSDENVIVFLLDAYDTQFVEMVLEDEPDYLAPLKDFTYYNNMESRYYYTDFSLPFLLNAPKQDSLNVTDKSETEAWYQGSHFLSDISGAGYDINILTERKYIKNIEEGLVSNYTDDGYCILDAEKTMAAFANAMRYKNMPFAIKGIYRYEVFDLFDAIAETNIYRMGTDDVIDKLIKEGGLNVMDDKKAFRFYHLYGAHAPYYLTENNEMDYSSCNPRAQFRGCLLTVYDYMDKLKEDGLYDNSTIIIMADHGLNPGQVDALTAAGETCNADKSNPIFFIKEKGEVKDSMAVDSKETSHDMFFDTIMKCINPDHNNEYYGSVWD